MDSFASAIKYWRKKKGLSQLDLSLFANISTKHISFLETARSEPSKEMVLKLSNALDVPLSERNVLLALAGFSEAYSRMSFDQSKMKAVNEALELMLDNHNPFPAMVFDWDWNIVKANSTQIKLDNFIRNIQPEFSESGNIMELLFDPKGYRQFIKNWDQVASNLLLRVEKERLIQPDRHSDLIERLLSFGNIPVNWEQGSIDEHLQPMLYIDFEVHGQSLKLFSTISSFGTAVDITMQELVIEQYFPVDDSTKYFFNEFLKNISEQ